MPIIMVPKEHEDELMHYGVPGMKWGVHRALYKSAANTRLGKKALKYDIKAAKLRKKSEKLHADEDLGRANRKAVKAAKYDKKAAKLEKRAEKSGDSLKTDLLYKRSEKLKYKASKARRVANRISKSKGYGIKSLKYSIKSDKYEAKAAKARMKIANNKYYINKMKRKASQIPKAEVDKGYQFINKLKEI